MTNVVRRFLLLLAVMFWQGGFTFHGAVVVHAGKKVLGSHLEQGYITRLATNYLNLAGAVALVLWVWDLAATRDPATVRNGLRWGLWGLLLLTLGLLAGLHVWLDELLDPDAFSVLDGRRFRHLHRWYLNISTAQWGTSLLLLLLTLLAWRCEDRKQSGSPGAISLK